MSYGKFDIMKDTSTGQEYLQSSFGDILLDDGGYAKKISLNDFKKIVQNERAVTSDISTQSDIVKLEANEKRSNIIEIDHKNHNKIETIKKNKEETSTNENKAITIKEESNSISWWKFALIAITGLIAGLYFYNKRQ